MLDKDLLESWERVVFKHVRFSKKKDLSSDEALAQIVKQEKKNIHSIWEAYTTERSSLGHTALNTKKALISYLLGFHLSNAARMKLALNRLDTRNSLIWEFLNLDEASKIKLYDLGCGTGAMTQTLITTKLLPYASKTNVFLYDRASILLDAAKDVINETVQANISSSRLDINQISPDNLVFKPENEKDIDIYILGYVWNELHTNTKAKNNIQKLFNNVATNKNKSLIFLFDPANRIPCIKLMMLRDILINNGLYSIYPCPTSGPCPMLKNDTDWCYSEAEWKQPKHQQLLDRLLEINRTKIASSIFVFANKPVFETYSFENKNNIVVGRPIRKKRYPKGTTQKEFDYLICNGKLISKKAPKDQSETPLLRGETI